MFRWDMVDHEKIISSFIKEANGLGQTPVLMIWWRYASEYPQLRYELLKLMTKYARGRQDKYPKEWLKVSRNSFNWDNIHRNRYGKNEVCFLHDYELNQKTYAVKHHIVKLSSWGTNRPINIVTLCSRCHAYFHPWLRIEPVSKEPYCVPRRAPIKASMYHS